MLHQLHQQAVSSVKVGVRVRPLLPREKNQPLMISINDSTSLQFKNSVNNSDATYTFDHVFGSDLSQEELYKETAAPMLRSFLEGYNVTIMAYGQTGSGKTFTMGTADLHSNESVKDDFSSQQGLIPRFVTDLFNNIEDNISSPSQSLNYKVKISFLEIYGEDVYDLIPLAHQGHPGFHSPLPTSHRNERVSLTVREDENSKVFVQGQHEVEANNADAVMDLLSIGSKNRVTASTNMNAGSSRSHAVFTVSLEQLSRPKSKDAAFPTEDQGAPVNTCSKLTFVDLAGSERIKRTGAEGQRLKEGIQINSGLFNLGQVINSLADDQKLKSGSMKNVHVPYRNSKLTHLLKDALGGNSQTLFLACVSPAECNENETQSTLNYAKQARNIQNKPVKNLDKNQLEIRRLRLVARAWMQRAVSLLFENKLSISSSSSTDRNTSTSMPALYPPSWSLSDAEEDRLLSFPEVSRYVDAMNQSVAESLGGCAPIPRKIRLSSGFSGWSPCMSPVKPSSSAHTAGKSRHQSVDTLSGQQQGMFQVKSTRSNSVRESVQKIKSALSSSLCTEPESVTTASGEEIEHNILGESLDDFGGSLSSSIARSITQDISSSSSDKPDRLIEKLIESLDKQRDSFPFIMAHSSSSVERNPSEDPEYRNGVFPSNTADSSSEFTAQVDIAILEKEELLAKLMETVKNYANIKSEFEKLLNAINDLETEKRSLETELEQAKNVMTSSSQANPRNNPPQSSFALEQMKERFQKVKEELRLMREERKRKENTYKMVQRDSKQCESLQKELQKLKQSKVFLLKQQKQQFLQLQKLKKEQAQKIQLSKKSEVRKQQQLNSLKSELTKKDRVLGHRSKEINRVCAKLKVCEEHIAQLLKVQSRNRLKSCHSMSNVNLCDPTVSQSDRKNGSNGPSSQTGVSLDTEHYTSSKNMLKNIIIDKVERNQVQLLYVRKTRCLQQWNQLLLHESRELEDLIDDKRNLLSEVVRGSSTEDDGLETDDVLDNEASLIKQGAICEGDLLKLKQINSSIYLLETNIERLTAAIDALNADLDELSLKLENQNFNGSQSVRFLNSDDALSGTFSEKDSDSLWDSMGKEIIANLSLTQSHSLLWELVSEKADALEKLELYHEDIQHLQLNADLCSDRLKDALAQISILKREMTLRFEEAEAKRINDIWLLSKAATEWSPNSTPATVSVEPDAEGSREVVVPPTHALVLSVALKKAIDLEVQLDQAVSNEHRLIEENEHMSKVVTALEESISELQMRSKLSDSSSSGDGVIGKLGNIGDSQKSLEGVDVLRNLSVTWIELGLPQSDRDEAISYVQSSRARTLERVLADAQSMRSAVQKDVIALNQTIAVLCNILGVSPQELYIKANVPAVDESLPLMQKVKQLEKVKTAAEEELCRLLPKLLSAKDRLLEVVAEMWLDIVDIHPALHQVLRLKVSNLTQSPNSDMAQVIVELDNAKLCLADLDGVIEVEIRKLNLQRVQTTLKLIETRTETIALMEELEIKQAHEVDQLFQAFKFSSDGHTSIQVSSDALSNDTVKAAVQLVVVNSASNPPGSQKLLFALQRLKFILESVKVNRSTLFDLLTRLLVLCQESLLICTDKQQLKNVEYNYGRLQLDQRLELVEAIESELLGLQSSVEKQLISICRSMNHLHELSSNEDRDRDHSTVSLIKQFKDQCHIAFNTGDVKSPVFDQIRSFETAMHDIIADLEGMAAFTEETWLRDRIADVCGRWAAPDDDLRVISRQVCFLTSEETRLSQLLDSYKDLLRLDVQLVKHTSELEEFEHSSKQDRAKAFTGNSKLLIEEEKFRKTGKKKFEHISEKLLLSFNKLQQSSTAIDGLVMETKPNLESLSEQSRALIKGKLKERAELMHLELISHGAGGAVVSKAPTTSGPTHKLSIASSQASLPMGSPSPGPKNLTSFGLRPTTKTGKHTTTTATHSGDENSSSNDTNASSVHSKSSADETPKSRVRIIL